MILELSDLDQGDQNYVAHEILYYIPKKSVVGP